MALDFLTAALKKASPRAGLKPVPDQGGYVRYAQEAGLWSAEGFNSSKATAGKVTVNFGAAATASALPGGEAIINISMGNGDSVALRLKNSTAANVTWASLLLIAVNGSPSSLQNGALTGFVATATGNVVTITGKPGYKFLVTTALFGETFNGVLNPAAPVVTATIQPVCPGIIPFGVAVGIDLEVNAKMVNGRQSNIISDPSKILSLPTGSPTWKFVGITCLPLLWVQDYTTECCDNAGNIKIGYSCHECVHYFNNLTSNTNQLSAYLEQATAGDTTTSTDMVGKPLSYRIGTGTLSVGAPVADATRALCRSASTGAQLIVTSINDLATRKIFLGVNR
jgi:hypothetical protein